MLITWLESDIKKPKAEVLKYITVSKMLHVRGILYSRCALFDQTRADLEKAKKALIGSDAELLSDCQTYLGKTYDEKNFVCAACGDAASKFCDNCRASYCLSLIHI